MGPVGPRQNVVPERSRSSFRRHRPAPNRVRDAVPVTASARWRGGRASLQTKAAKVFRFPRASRQERPQHRPGPVRRRAAQGAQVRGHLGVVVLEEPLDRVQRRQRRLGPAREPAARPLAEEAYDRLEGAQRVALERERERVDGRRQPVRVGERRAPAPERAAALDERRRRVAPRAGRAPPARSRGPRPRRPPRPARRRRTGARRTPPASRAGPGARATPRAMLGGKLALLTEDPPQAAGVSASASHGRATHARARAPPPRRGGGGSAGGHEIPRRGRRAGAGSGAAGSGAGKHRRSGG